MLDGQPVNVIELGEGPPLVFVHGLSGRWPNWLEQLPRVRGEHRVIALDLPGFGHSPMPREQISISGYARMLDRLLDALEIDAAALVGNSMGGFISAELAIAFPQRVERLVLVSAAGISHLRQSDAADAPVARAAPIRADPDRLSRAWMASQVRLRRAAVALRLREATLNVVTRHPSAACPRRWPRSSCAARASRASSQALEANLNYDFRERLGEIACPTLIVWGER